MMRNQLLADNNNRLVAFHGLQQQQFPLPQVDAAASLEVLWASQWLREIREAAELEAASAEALVAALFSLSSMPPPPCPPFPDWVPPSLRTAAEHEPLLRELSDAWVSGLWAWLQLDCVPEVQALTATRKVTGGFLQLVFGFPPGKTLSKVNTLAVKLRTVPARSPNEHYGVLRAWRLTELPTDVSFLVVALYRAFWRARKALIARLGGSSCNPNALVNGSSCRIDPHYIGKSLRRLQNKLLELPPERQYVLALDVMAHVEMLCILGCPPSQKGSAGSNSNSNNNNSTGNTHNSGLNHHMSGSFSATVSGSGGANRGCGSNPSSHLNCIAPVPPGNGYCSGSLSSCGSASSNSPQSQLPQPAPLPVPAQQQLYLPTRQQRFAPLQKLQLELLWRQQQQQQQQH